MKTNRNIKPLHNGKNRRTGRPSGARRTQKAAATANNPQAEEIRLAWVAAKTKAREEKESRRKDGPCCSTDSAKQATNLFLLKKLQATVCDRVWNNELGRWEGIMPRRFVRENAAHMSHFRDFARKQGYRSR
tara:strand:- start:1323 stop:1718 length:396 start_codon:yes stop_codon:yes gene_type:complete